MLTGQTQNIEQMRGWEAGADEYISKSDDLGPLMATIDKRLQAK